jgi:uncharacterized protein (TIGR03067 family)
MRKLILFAAVLVVLASSRADEKVAAPVPKAPVPPSIDGKYTLLTSTGSGPTGPGKKGVIDPTDPTSGNWGPRPTVRSEVVITKNEITIEPRTVSAAPIIMEYTLDTTKTPIAIDAESINARGKKTKMLGVVEISGNRLTIALARSGDERPKTVDEADGVMVYYFLKAPPPPKVEYRIVAMTVGKEEAAEKELNKLAEMGFEVVNTTNPAAVNDKASPTTVHFLLKRTVK